MWPRRRLLGSSVVVIAAIAVIFLRSRPVPEDLARAARKAFASGEGPRARQLLRQALNLAPSSAEVLVAAGELAEKSGDSAQALEYYDRVPADGTVHAVVGAGAAGDLLLKSNRLSDAESRYRMIVAVQPHHILANRRLAAILVMGGRRRESAKYLFELVRLEECDPDELALFGSLEQIFGNDELINRLCAAAPDDPCPRLGKARIAMQNNRISAALEILEPLVVEAPGLWEARVNLGKLIVRSESTDAFLGWERNLPAELDQNPDVWNIRGLFAERQGERDAAVRCYWEALRRDPNVAQANYKIAVLLAASNDPRAQPFVERSKRLDVLADVLARVLTQGTTAELALTAARETEGLGRLWEAANWYRFAIKLEPDLADASLGRKRLSRQLTTDLPQVIDSSNPALALDFSSYPLPGRKSTAAAHSAASIAAGATGAAVRFADVAEAVGLRFTYENGDNREVPGMRTWQSFGGGVAVLDFDADGWPDLHFTQGGDFPARPGKAQPPDRLFRNLGGGKFADATNQAGIGDPGYGQGLAAGDYDNDGFADLYLANIGPNRLYHNQGDGTFIDVTGGSGITGAEWTSSCLLADLNGDGLPDIYDVNYLAGREPIDLQCKDQQLDEPRICAPSMFDGAEDRLYVNRGDGTFEDATSTSGISALHGKGLGVAAADFAGRGRVDLLVSNDTTPNLYFVNETACPGAPPKFSERGVEAGCAYNGMGRSHANMGIAVADADGDGLLDFCITAFFREYAVLYLQKPAGTFTDRSSESGLKGPTAMLLGFGTQFLDADLDGWPDLVVANGHVDDYSKKGTPYRMRPQFFANRGRGRFAELPASELGEYFERELLGRGLARLDWNRDGREDFVVSHLDSPAALVTNQSRDTGHFLALQLRGVQSSRDAVGAVVRVTAAGRTRMQQITAGDGYYASNQKQLIFGLAEANSIDELQIRWPSGLEQNFTRVPADREFLLVEGRGQLHRLPSP